MTIAQAAQRATLDEAIVDSSALMCILMGEPAAPLFITALQKTTWKPGPMAKLSQPNSGLSC